MKKHLTGILTALVLVCAMLLNGCITIVAPTRTPESVMPEETTKAEPATKATESVSPTEKTDAPETQAPTTEEPATEPPTEPEGPPEAKVFESLPVLARAHAKNDWDASIMRNKYVVIWPQFAVLGQDWPEFAEAIEKWNVDADKSGLTLYTDNLENARKSFDPNMNNWEDQINAKVQRADEKIFSVLLEHVAYHGGAHPGSAFSSLNMDPKTGKVLNLSDVVKEADAFTEKALSLLEKQNKDNSSPFFDGYKDTFTGLLQKELNGEDASGLTWVFEKDSLRLVADEYILAPYAYGPVYVDVPFYEDGTLYLDGSYYAASEGLFWAFSKEGSNYSTTLLEEGPNGKRIITVMDWPGTYYGEYELWVGELATKKDRGMGLSNVYMTAKDGKYHTFIEYYYENGYSQIDVYEITEQNFKFLETMYGEIVPLVKDTGNLFLKENGDALGTWTGYAKLRLQEDGTLKPDDVYMFDNRDDSFFGNTKRTLTTKIEVRAFFVEDPKKEIKIPAGTVVVPYETDFASFVDVILPDGSLAQIRYVRDPGSYNYLIDGVSQFDVFDGIMYAG